MTRSLPLALTGLLVLAGCATPSLPYPPVPAPLAETVPKPPVSEAPLIWQPGHYDWTGSAYVWTAGSYVPRAEHVTWMPGYWTGTSGSYVWVPAHWTS